MKGRGGRHNIDRIADERRDRGGKRPFHLTVLDGPIASGA
jgi:hypothetical protein